MANKKREVVSLIELEEYLHYEDDDEDRDGVAYYLAYEEGLWEQIDDEQGEQILEIVDHEITYTDLEKSYQRVTNVYRRLSDGKFFSWSYTESPYRSIGDSCDDNITEVFPVTQMVEVTTYE